MKSSFGFWGIALSLLFDFINGKTVATPGGCGSSSPGCKDLCDFCDDTGYRYTRLSCYGSILNIFCLEKLLSTISALNATDLCTWEYIRRPYSSFSECTEEMANCLQIPWPNQLVEDTFVDIHATYFKACHSKEFEDPPPGVIFALVITPICLIPAMVVLVVLKTNEKRLPRSLVNSPHHCQHITKSAKHKGT
ncbi:receptor activity-modifying protein 1-like [Scleropages formosus]|uniref:Receptor (G protein-coupled) activity modifying protein 2 n=1 Tax=Scleropages formosus TaxID=113540 RepID=A0A8C9T803_SCLFO|nr:receptor activity-modifying protein 1-like [Scleropages formosus]